jgi:hypothetical protein
VSSISKAALLETEAQQYNKPGVYAGIKQDVYFAIPAVNQSTLKQFAKNPRAWKDGIPRKFGGHLNWGNLFETLLLEPERFAEDYTVLTEELKEEISKADRKRIEFSKRLGAYQAWKKERIKNELEWDGEEFLTQEVKNEIVRQAEKLALKAFSRSGPAWEAFKSEQDAKWKTIVSESDAAEAQLAVDRCLREKNISDLLTDGGQAQVAIVWDDPDTGIRCKGLIDYVPNGLGSLCDVKTTRQFANASSESAKWAFHRDAKSFGYYWQAGFYLDGWTHARAQSGMQEDRRDDWLFVVSDNAAPYPAAGLRAKADSINDGRKAYREALALWQHCHDYDEWPGIAPHGDWPVIG